MSAPIQSASGYWANDRPVRMIPTMSTVRPEPEPVLDANQFYALNNHVFKTYRESVDMMRSRKETVTIYIGDKSLQVHRELLTGIKAFNIAFTLPLREKEEKTYYVQYELASETNIEFEFQAHLVLFVALYGETRLPEAVYNFDNQAGPILVRALALAEYRIAADYVNDRINTMITAYFNRLVDWKTTIPCAPNHLLLETHKKYIAEINDTFIAYRDSNIRRRKFPLQSFGHLIALHCPPDGLGDLPVRGG
ncbi:hypothetical protein PG999_005320 [Apiospora kogelbergensis]|uniref:BTB domain-containing protein n=1 Tax=Apiospora kogelbergensis TaxID=1337665 RepID=A0AAW0R1T4_9PEZI